MDVRIFSSIVLGELRAISSKSHAHRLLIASSLATQPVTIGINALSRDIEATITCLRSMGAVISQNQHEFTVKPVERNIKSTPPVPILDCGESGSTARFLLPVASVLRNSFVLTGSGRLPERPFSPLCREMIKNGCSFDRDCVPLRADGQLHAGTFKLEGNISSQFISGLLFALPLLNGESRIVLTTPLESAPYVDLTIQTLASFGVQIKHTTDGFSIPGNQVFTAPARLDTEGDWSNAAFFLSLGALCGRVKITGLNTTSVQGDRRILALLEQFGAKTVVTKKPNNDTAVTVKKNALQGIDIDAAQIPDLVPVLAAVASLAEGSTRIYNVGRLHLKESDRMFSTYDTLTALGADIRMLNNELVIRGKPQLSGGTVKGQNDHRIVMTAAVASCGCKNPVVITGAEAVKKSYPDFFTDLQTLGGTVTVIK